jgi:hypothetical protein
MVVVGQEGKIEVDTIANGQQGAAFRCCVNELFNELCRDFGSPGSGVRAVS